MADLVLWQPFDGAEPVEGQTFAPTGQWLSSGWKLLGATGLPWYE